MLPRTLLILAALATPAAAQTVGYTRVADLTTTVRPYGDRPVLDAGVVAFLGTHVASGVDGIFKAPVATPGSFRPVVWRGDPIPSLPGESFLYIDNPEIHAGVVAFTGGHQLTTSAAKDGIFAGSGGPLEVLYDKVAGGLGNPNPFGPSWEPEGLVFRNVGTNPSDFLKWTSPWRVTASGAAQNLVPAPLPGGGGFVKLTELGDLPTQGGGQLAFSAVVSLPDASERGVYTVDLATGVGDLVARWDTPMPGTGGNFEHFRHVDTDGQHVAFVGQRGFVGFGGHQGVYRAPVGAGGAGPLELIAEIGTEVPGGGAAFESFGNVATQDGLVLFHAWLDTPGSGNPTGIYGWYDGALFTVADTTTPILGEDFMGFDFNTRGLDGDQLVFRATYPGQFATEWALIVADLGLSDEPVCQADLGFGGPGAVALSVCGEALASGGSAELLLTGAPAASTAWLVASTQLAPQSFKGGTLAPQPDVLLALTTDGAGELLVPSVPGGGGPLDVHVQFVVEDAGQALGFALSNAVTLEYLP